MPEINDRTVGPIGFGMMGLTGRDNPLPQERSFAVLRAAVENGNTFWKGGEFYGPPGNNSLTLAAQYFAAYPEDADRLVVSIKAGHNSSTGRMEGSPENTRRSIDHCISLLHGRRKIDLFQFARVNKNVPLSTTLGVIEEEYVKTGKIGGLGLSEVDAETIEEAVKYTKVLGVEVELSMFATDPLLNNVAQTCAKHSIPLIAYSPLCRGMLTSRFKHHADIPSTSLLIQHNFPRFQPENFAKNRRLAEEVERIAAEKGRTTAQLAIGWVLALGRVEGMSTVVPIPGSTTVERVRENAVVVELTGEEMKRLHDLITGFEVLGERYPEKMDYLGVEAGRVLSKDLTSSKVSLRLSQHLHCMKFMSQRHRRRRPLHKLVFFRRISG